MWYGFSISWVKPMLFTYLPEYWAPPVGWSLDLEIILILPDGSGTVLIKLVQVGPDSIALVPALGSSLCLPGPTDVAARTHPSWLEWQHPQASARWCPLASGSKGILKVRTRLSNVSLIEQCSFSGQKRYLTGPVFLTQAGLLYWMQNHPKHSLTRTGSP